MAAPPPFAKAVSGPIFPALMISPVYMDAVIRPNRSLTDRGFLILIIVVAAANTGSAVVFLRIGAPIIPLFLGLALLAVIVAFRASFRAARRVERVRVTARDIRVTHEAPGATRLVWESPTAFTRVEVVKDEDRTVGVNLALSGREVPVAEALSPRERGQFALALQQAIREARAERG